MCHYCWRFCYCAGTVGLQLFSPLLLLLPLQGVEAVAIRGDKDQEEQTCTLTHSYCCCCYCHCRVWRL